MAINPTYEHSNVMSKLDVNGSTYWLKDADLRAIIANFGDAVYKDVADGIAKGNVNLTTSGDVAQAIEDAVKDLEGAMHFRGIVEKREGETDIEALARVIATPKSGDVAIIKGNGKEYIYNGTTWEEVGDQNIYLTKAEAASTYTPMTRTVAGKALDHNITVAELSGTDALDLKALAHKASATGNISTVDSGTVTAAKSGEYTVSSQTVVIPSTYDALDVTPAGTVGVTKSTGATVKYDKTTGITVGGTAAASQEAINYTPAGTVSAPSITVTPSFASASAATVTNAGTAYSLANGSVTQGADTKDSFLKKGYKIEMDATDTEKLNILNLTSSDTTFFAEAVTASGEIDYEDPVLSGSLPTFGTVTNLATTGSTFAASASAPTFTGTGATLTAEATTTSTNATVTDATYTGSFSGTAASVTPTVKTTTAASVTAGKVTVASDTFDVNFERSSKTVTVE